MAISVSVVVMTDAQSTTLDRCLTSIGALAQTPHETLVVDFSDDGRGRSLVAERFPRVQVIGHGFGSLSRSDAWRLACASTEGDVIAFIGDDVFVDTDWLEQLTAAYRDENVGAVGGRVHNGAQSDESDRPAEIGRLLPNGRLTGNFAADPGRAIEVDHLPAPNMSFRRTALRQIGGFRSGPPGHHAHVPTDAQLRLRQSGWTLIYQPDAIAHQSGENSGPRSLRHGDLYYARRNHLALLIGVFGWRGQVPRRFVLTTIRDQSSYFSNVRVGIAPRMADGSHRPLRRRVTAPLRLTRVATNLLGLATGFLTALIAASHKRGPAIDDSTHATWESPRIEQKDKK